MHVESRFFDRVQASCTLYLFHKFLYPFLAHTVCNRFEFLDSLGEVFEFFAGDFVRLFVTRIHVGAAEEFETLFLGGCGLRENGQKGRIVPRGAPLRITSATRDNSSRFRFGRWANDVFMGKDCNTKS
ncbi:MAG: hypothetical protein JXA11_10615 [Phycisphaerae bacterium]|nr:hypothetical protein [Phycisphaerae bacterium]